MMVWVIDRPSRIVWTDYQLNRYGQFSPTAVVDDMAVHFDLLSCQNASQYVPASIAFNMELRLKMLLTAAGAAQRPPPLALQL